MDEFFHQPSNSTVTPDKRYRLTLTSTGRQLLDKVIPRAVELADHTLSGISPTQLRQMRRNLALIESRLRGYMPLAKPEE